MKKVTSKLTLRPEISGKHHLELVSHEQEIVWQFHSNSRMAKRIGGPFDPDKTYDVTITVEERVPAAFRRHDVAVGRSYSPVPGEVVWLDCDGRHLTADQADQVANALKEHAAWARADSTDNEEKE